MELRHLRYFVTVAELLNFTKAAAKLRVAQPALSRQIHDLEDELGVPLLERNSRFVRLTNAGRAFVEEAHTVLQHAQSAVRTARAFATGERGEIQVGYAPTLAVELLPQALSAFEKVSPRVWVTLHDLSVHDMLQAVREGRLDAALTVVVSPKQIRGLSFRKLREYPVCVALAAKHRLARTARITFAQLKEERLIVYSRAEYPDYDAWLRSLFQRMTGTVPTELEEHASGTGLIAAVEAGRGIAIVPSILSVTAGPRIKLRKLDPTPEPFAVGIVSRRRHLSPAATRFVKVVTALQT